MVAVELVAMTQVNWSSFLTCAAAVRRSPMREIDARGFPPNTPASYIAALGELESPGRTPEQVLVQCSHLLRHVSASFFAVCDRDTFLRLAVTTELKLCGDERGFVVSGNLEEWREAVVGATTGREPFEMRLLMDKFVYAFDCAGLSPIFCLWQKTAMPDQTFRLELK